MWPAITADGLINGQTHASAFACPDAASARPQPTDLPPTRDRGHRDARKVESRLRPQRRRRDARHRPLGRSRAVPRL